MKAAFERLLGEGGGIMRLMELPMMRGHGWKNRMKLKRFF